MIALAQKSCVGRVHNSPNPGEWRVKQDTDISYHYICCWSAIWDESWANLSFLECLLTMLKHSHFHSGICHLFSVTNISVLRLKLVLSLEMNNRDQGWTILLFSPGEIWSDVFPQAGLENLSGEISGKGLKLFHVLRLSSVLFSVISEAAKIPPFYWPEAVNVSLLTFIEIKVARQVITGQSSKCIKLHIQISAKCTIHLL